MTGKDVAAILPTGAGKSLTFQLPALAGDGPSVNADVPAANAPSNPIAGARALALSNINSELRNTLGRIAKHSSMRSTCMTHYRWNSASEYRNASE